MKLENIVSIKQLDPKTIKAIFAEMKMFDSKKYENILAEKIALIFFHGNRIIRMAFESAVLKMGGRYVSGEAESSSMKKRESIRDIMRIFSGYPVDVIIFSWNRKNGAEWAEKFCSLPFINAGEPDNDPITELTACYLREVWNSEEPASLTPAEFSAIKYRLIMVLLKMGLIGYEEQE